LLEALAARLPAPPVTGQSDSFDKISSVQSAISERPMALPPTAAIVSQLSDRVVSRHPKVRLYEPYTE
jgi:hypothetical protein